MAHKAIRFSDIKIIDDGAELIIKAGANELLKFNKSTKNVTNVITFDSAVTLKNSALELISVPASGTKAIAGEATLLSAGGEAYADVSTAAVKSDSIIIVTPKERLDGRNLWYDSIVADRSFRINSDSPIDDNKKVAWLLINPA